MFTSDNGGERFSDTWPLVGKKMDLLEGGIRVPYIVRWPRGVRGRPHHRAGSRSRWTGWRRSSTPPASRRIPHYPLDGISLLLRARAARELFWRMKFRDQKAARIGDWKYLSIEGDEFLFDLARDSRERANLRHRHPEKFEALRARYQEWEATMPAIPADARVSFVTSKATLAQPS